MANNSHEMATSLSLASRGTRDLFMLQEEYIRELLDEKAFTDTEQALQDIMVTAIKHTNVRVHLRFSGRKTAIGPRTVSAELYAKELCDSIWSIYRGRYDIAESCPFKPDAVDESQWYLKPLSPEHAEYMAKAAEASAKREAERKAIESATNQAQAPAVLPHQGPASQVTSVTEEAFKPQPTPPAGTQSRASTSAGEGTSKSQPTTGTQPKANKASRSRSKNRQTQGPRTRDESDAKSTTRTSWADEVREADEKFQTLNIQRNKEQAANGTKVEPVLVDSYIQTSEDGKRVGIHDNIEYNTPANAEAPIPGPVTAPPAPVPEAPVPAPAPAAPVPEPKAPVPAPVTAPPAPNPEPKAPVPAPVPAPAPAPVPAPPTPVPEAKAPPVPAPAPVPEPKAPVPAPAPAPKTGPATAKLVHRSKNKQATARTQCIKAAECDDEVSEWIWKTYVAEWAASNHTGQPWHVSISADKGHLLFGPYGNNIFDLMAMCPRGAHLRTHYGGDELFVGVYVKMPTSGARQKEKQAKFRMVPGHDTAMVQLFHALLDWSTVVNMGVDRLFIETLKSEHRHVMTHYRASLRSVVKEATKNGVAAMESHARAEEADRSHLAYIEERSAAEKAKEEAARKARDARLEEERLNLDRGARDIIKNAGDERSTRRALKVLVVVDTDDYLSDEALRWTIAVQALHASGKGGWASGLMWAQGYGKTSRS